MYTITSTYDEWAPEFDDYPNGRKWPGDYENQEAAWEAVRRYLLTEQRWHPAPFRNSADPKLQDGLAPHGQQEPLAFPWSTEILNDAETITITA